MQQLLQREYPYKPVQYFLFVILITWTSWFIAAWLSHRANMTGLQLLFMAPGLFAPFIVMLWLVRGPENSALRKDITARLSLTRINPVTLPVLLLLMPFTVLLATTTSLLFGQSAEQFQIASELKVMDGQLLLSLLIMILAPTFEELGWRGYGVDSIRVKYNLFNTSLIFSALWALWHLPLFFVQGYYHYSLWNTSAIYVINYFVSIPPAVFLMNWLFYKNKRNILVLILFHFLLNLFAVSFQTEQFTKCIITIIMLIVSVIVVIKDKEFFFNPSLKTQVK